MWLIQIYKLNELKAITLKLAVVSQYITRENETTMKKTMRNNLKENFQGD